MRKPINQVVFHEMGYSYGPSNSYKWAYFLMFNQLVLGVLSFHLYLINCRGVL